MPREVNVKLKDNMKEVHSNIFQSCRSKISDEVEVVNQMAATNISVGYTIGYRMKMHETYRQ